MRWQVRRRTACGAQCNQDEGHGVRVCDVVWWCVEAVAASCGCDDDTMIVHARCARFYTRLCVLCGEKRGERDFSRKHFYATHTSDKP